MKNFTQLLPGRDGSNAKTNNTSGRMRGGIRSKIGSMSLKNTSLFGVILALLLTFGVGEMWADKSIWEWKLYYWNGSSNQWLGGDNNTGDLNFGVVDGNYYWKGAWAKTADNNSNSVTVYYVEPDGTQANFSLTYQSCWDNCWNKFWKNESECNLQLTSSSFYKNNPGVNTIQFYVQIDGENKLTPKATYTIPGFTTTSASQTFDNTTVGSNSSKTISFGQHYGTALSTSNCALSGTNSTEFEVTSISETGVTVKFKPSTAGNKSATLTITDAHSKTCTITLSGKAQYTLTYSVGSVAGTDGSFSTSPSTSSGSYVDAETNVTLTAPEAKTGYTWKGWYTDAAGTTGKIEDTNRAITVTMDADKTLYACYTENNYTVTVNAGSHGSVASASVTGHKDTKVTLPTATADLGYYFTGWTTTTGTVTYTNQSSASSAQVNGLTAAATVQANFAPIWALVGSMNSWDATTNTLGNFTTVSTKDYGYVDVDLNANTQYSFKIKNVQASAFYKPTSSNTEITYANKATAQ